MFHNYRWWMLVDVVVLILGLAVIQARQLPPTNPRVTPNCTGINAVRPLSTTLPVGVNYTVTISGCNFGASAGTVKVCNQATFGGTCATASPLLWSATSVSAVIRAGSLAVGNTVYLYVTDASNNTNTTGLGGFPLGRSALWVRLDGNDSCNGTSNIAGSSGNCAWRHIDWAMDHATAGDEIRVQPGTYVEVATPNVSGTSGNPVTIVASGVVTTCGLSISNKNDIRVIGIKFDPNAGTCGGAPSPIVSISGTNTRLEFWNNDIGNLEASMATGGTAQGIGTFQPSDRCDSCILLGNRVHNICTVACSDNAINMLGNDNVVAYTLCETLSYLCINPAGSRSRFLNLNASGLLQIGLSHPDFFFINVSNASLGWSFNLIESLYGIGTATASDNKVLHIESSTAAAFNDNVSRFNLIYNMGSGYYSKYNTGGGSPQLRWRYYNDTVVDCDRAQDQNNTSFNNCGNFSTQNGPGMSVSLFNNLYQRAWGHDNVATANVVWGTSCGSNPCATFTADYNLAYSPIRTESFVSPWTDQAHPKTNINPLLTNVGIDFTVQAGSPACGGGGPLTTTSGSGSGSTSLTVATSTGSFFIGSNATNLSQYGGGLVPGDFITVGSTTVQVSSVSGDVLTLATPISWNNGDPVYFGKSTVIDIGAYPCKTGGFALSATKSIVAGTATIIPNDSSLVRWVVFYSGGVPYAVDNSSPYTAPMPTGVFSARVYSRYASPTRWVTVQ